METEATKRYKELCVDNQTMLARLKVLIKKHQRLQNKNPKNWGYVSEIAHLNKGIFELLEFMGDNKTSTTS